MDMMPISLTGIASPIHEWAEIALWKPPPSSDMSNVQSQFVAFKANPYEVFVVHTGAAAPTAVSTARPTSGQQLGAGAVPGSPSPTAGVDAIARERVKILAAKYATGGKDKEVLARLEILNRRLLTRAPTVTTEQVAFLENVHDSLAELNARSEARARRLGMPVAL